MWKIIVDLHFHNTVQVQIKEVMRHTCSAAISSHEYVAVTVNNPWMFRATCLATHRAESRTNFYFPHRFLHLVSQRFQLFGVYNIQQCFEPSSTDYPYLV